MESPRKPGRSPTNRSLERGADILRAFRPGSATLGNTELAERSGLSKSTVSRLTQTLVRTGLLQFDGNSRAYRLAPAVLSLAHAMRTGSRVLQLAAPRMRALAEAKRMLEEAGLQLGDVAQQTRDDVPPDQRPVFDKVAPGSVLSASPNYGTFMPRGSRITVAIRKP